MNKHIILLVFAFFLLCISCEQKKSNDRIITVTIEPQRYFLEQLVDSIFKIHTMVPPGVSPETYDPSPVQMAKLANSRAYFRIGQIGFEISWMDKIHENNPNLKIFDNSNGITFISSDDESEEGQHNHQHTGFDPHIWSSPKEALIIARNMYQSLEQIDNENKEIYHNNLEKLNRKIEETDKAVSALLEKAKSKSFIIYHPALTYLARDYGLTQYCIEIDGKEPTPEQLRQLIELAKEKNIRTIFIQQEFDQKNAEIIAKETNTKLVVINPLAYEWDKEMIRIAEALSHE